VAAEEVRILCGDGEEEAVDAVHLASQPAEGPAG